ADTLLDRLAQGAAQLLLERTGAETEGGDAAEYDAGRLYLLSDGDRPILRARARQAMVAHLFADMKDFTRRTTYLKEVLIADYLQREFYGPILRAAALDPSGRPGGRPVVALNNLLGDAVSFSGDVVALFQLARRIKAVLAESAQRSEGDATQIGVATRVRELEARYRVRRDALERQVRELVFRAPRAPPERRDEMLAPAQQKRAERGRLEAEHQAALSLAAGEKLEAGVF